KSAIEIQESNTKKRQRVSNIETNFHSSNENSQSTQDNRKQCQRCGQK
ncbi:7289_t:CDS:1, partial [Racocetra fulgida]